MSSALRTLVVRFSGMSSGVLLRSHSPIENSVVFFSCFEMCGLSAAFQVSDHQHVLAVAKQDETYRFF